MSQPNHKIGRNDTCPCLSGKKYKHCCATADNSAEEAQQSPQQLLENARYFAYQMGDFAAAEQAYRNLLKIQPNNAEALAGVGQGLCWRHRRAEGRQYLHKAAKVMLRNPNKTEASVLMELAEQLQLWGDIELALQLARAAAKKSPHNASANYAIAAYLHRLNHTDLAISAMHKTLQLAPNDSGCQILMALLETDNKQSESAQQRLESVIAKETDPKQLGRACLELAKVYDKQQRYSEAFSMLSRASELHQQLPETLRVDSNFIFAKIAHYKQGYDQNLLNRWTAADFTDGLPVAVFLIGFLRSGTTLTEQVLSAHPQVMTSDENSLLDELNSELANISGIKNDAPAALRGISIEQAKQLRQFYWQRASEEFGPEALKKVFVNKVALNSIEVGLISCLFPDAKILFALRDPRDITLSCATQSFTTSLATVNMLSWQGIAKQYAAVMDLWLSLREQIAPEYLQLRYEDTVMDFEASFKKVFKLLGLTWHDDVLHYHRKLAGKYVSTPSFSAVSQPLYQNAVARWRGYAPFFEPILPQLQPYISAFGYQ